MNCFQLVKTVLDEVYEEIPERGEARKDAAIEKELRMLHNLKYADVTTGPDSNGNAIYLFKFPVESVKEVILWCQMPSTARKEITSLIRSKYLSARVYQAEMSKTDFDLDIEEV